SPPRPSAASCRTAPPRSGRPRGRDARAGAPAAGKGSLLVDPCPALVDAAPLLARLLDLAGELLGELVDRGLHVRRRCLGMQDVPLEPDRPLRNLVRGDGRILLLDELNLHRR